MAIGGVRVAVADLPLPQDLSSQSFLLTTRMFPHAFGIADRIVVRLGDEVIAEHPRFFGRDRMILDPWPLRRSSG